MRGFNSLSTVGEYAQDSLLGALSGLCPETLTKLYVHEFFFRMLYSTQGFLIHICQLWEFWELLEDVSSQNSSSGKDSQLKRGLTWGKPMVHVVQMSDRWDGVELCYLSRIKWMPQAIPILGRRSNLQTSTVAFDHLYFDTHASQRKLRLHKTGGPELHLSSSNLTFLQTWWNDKRAHQGESSKTLSFFYIFNVPEICNGNYQMSLSRSY